MTDVSPPANPTPTVQPPAGAARPSPLALQLLLAYEALHRLALWAAALVCSLAVGRFFGWLPWRRLSMAASYGDLAFAGLEIAALVLAFNVAYLLLLVICRLVLRPPAPGRYPVMAARPSWAIINSALLGILTRERFQPIFPGFLVPMLANIPPFHRLMGITVGPNSRSPMFVEPNILDPWGITIGRNVVIGFGATLSAHLQFPDGIEFAPIIIEDDVVIGANCGVPGGVHMKRGAMLRATSVLLPNTIVGEGECWSGTPARKVRRVPDPSSSAPTPTEATREGT